MTAIHRFLLAMLALPLMLLAIHLTAQAETRAEGITVVLPDGRHIAASRVDYETGARRVVVIELPIFVDGVE